MAVRGLEQTTTVLDQAKRFGGWVVVSIIVAAIVVGALILSGLFGFVPAPRVTVFGIVLPSSWTAFFGAFTVALTIILAYIYFAKLVRSSVRKATAFWFDLPDPVQAVVLGVVAGLLAAASVYLTSRYLVSFRPIAFVIAVVGVGVPVTLLTDLARRRGWSLLGWMQTLFTSALIGAVVGVLSTFAFFGVIPEPSPPGLFVVAWGVCLFLLYRRRLQTEGSVITRILTRTGYAQMRRIETVPVSVVTGMILAFLVALVVGLAGTLPEDPFQRAGISMVLVWPMVTFATSLGWPTYEWTDLVIEDINVRSATELREVTLRNLGDRPVNLRNAKITDANERLYQANINVSLGAGEAAKLEIPETFELAVHDRYELYSLPFGLSVTKSATEPAVITRRGRKYKLRWIDQVQASSQEVDA